MKLWLLMAALVALCGCNYNCEVPEFRGIKYPFSLYEITHDHCQYLIIDNHGTCIIHKQTCTNHVSRLER